jgi:hypothetical protein
MYNDENLFNCRKPVYLPAHTIKEIQDHFKELPIYDVWENPKMNFLKIACYENAEMFYQDGRISQDHWEAYCAIWRNLTLHFSGVAYQYEF